MFQVHPILRVRNFCSRKIEIRSNSNNNIMINVVINSTKLQLNIRLVRIREDHPTMYTVGLSKKRDEHWDFSVERKDETRRGEEECSG